MSTMLEKKYVELIREENKVLIKSVPLQEVAVISEEIKSKKTWTNTYKRPLFLLDICVKDDGLVSNLMREGIIQEGKVLELIEKDKNLNKGFEAYHYRWPYEFEIICCRVLPYLYNDYPLLVSMVTHLIESVEEAKVFIVTEVREEEHTLRVYSKRSLTNLMKVVGLRYVKGWEDPNYPNMGDRISLFMRQGKGKRLQWIAKYRKKRWGINECET